MFSDKFDINGT